MARRWNNNRNRGSGNYRTGMNNTGGRSQNVTEGRPSREGGAGGGAWDLYNRLRALRLGSEQNGERPSWTQHGGDGETGSGASHQGSASRWGWDQQNWSGMGGSRGWRDDHSEATRSRGWWAHGQEDGSASSENWHAQDEWNASSGPAHQRGSNTVGDGWHRGSWEDIPTSSVGPVFDGHDMAAYIGRRSHDDAPSAEGFAWQQHSAQGSASLGARHPIQDQGVAVSSASHYQRNHTGEGNFHNSANDDSSIWLSRPGSQQNDARNSRAEPLPAVPDACTSRTRARQIQSQGDTSLDSLFDDVAETVAAERTLQFQMRVASHDTESWDRSIQLLRYLRTNRPKKKRQAIGDDLLRRDGEADATAMAPRESEPPTKRGATVDDPSTGVPWSVQGSRFCWWDGWHWDDELQLPFIPAGGTYLADDCPSLCWPEWAQYWHHWSMMHSACASGLGAAAETLAEEGTSVSGGQEAAGKSVIDSAADSEGAPGFWYY